ncbi:MAG: conjugal transfer protein TraX [Bacilli bacterium]|nr:conjugal transfer protein TraX [Bacilli bacterium]
MPEEKTPQILSGFIIKIIALIFMTLDHVGLFLMNKYYQVDPNIYQMAYVFRCLGRIALPLFLLLTAEGIRHSRNPWGYFFRLLGMNVGISLVLTILIYAVPQAGIRSSDIAGNAFADLSLLALTILLFRQKGWLKALAALPIAFAIFVYAIQITEHVQDVTVVFLPDYLRPSYSLLGLLIGLGFYFSYPIAERLSKTALQNSGISIEAYKESKGYRKAVNLVGITLFFLVLAAFWGISYIGYNYSYRPLDTYAMQIQSYCLLGIIPLYFYSGKRGYDSKAFRYATYLYYPVHLAILFLIFSL